MARQTQKKHLLFYLSRYMSAKQKYITEQKKRNNGILSFKWAKSKASQRLTPTYFLFLIHPPRRK